MVSVDLIAAIVFYFILILVFLKYRKKFDIQGGFIAIYRTKIGIGLMDKFAGVFPRFLKVLGIFSFLFGFFGMILTLILLVKATYDFLFVPGAVSSVAPLLPGIKLVPGLPVIPFWDWIISIFVVALVHEFLHGVYSRLYKVKVKSSGFVFFGPILGAFVEPDEKQLKKKKLVEQLSIFSAGPFANVITVVIIVFLFGFAITIPGILGNNPVDIVSREITSKTAVIDVIGIVQDNYEVKGLVVGSVDNNSSVAEAGFLGGVVYSINNISVSDNSTRFFEYLVYELEPGMEVHLDSNKGIFNFKAGVNPSNISKGYLGIKDLDVEVSAKKEFIEKYGMLSGVPLRLLMLLQWLILINLAVALFNLLPLGPLDGGRMFLVSMLALFKNEKIAKKIFIAVTLFCLAIILVNLWPFIARFFSFLLKPFMFLF